MIRRSLIVKTHQMAGSCGGAGANVFIRPERRLIRTPGRPGIGHFIRPERELIRTPGRPGRRMGAAAQGKTATPGTACPGTRGDTHRRLFERHRRRGMRAVTLEQGRGRARIHGNRVAIRAARMRPRHAHAHRFSLSDPRQQNPPGLSLCSPRGPQRSGRPSRALRSLPGTTRIPRSARVIHNDPLSPQNKSLSGLAYRVTSEKPNGDGNINF
jgi:hypothetical protein